VPSKYSDTEIHNAIQILKDVDIDTIQNFGYHFQPKNYYSPLNDLQFLRDNRDLWREPFEPLAIDWNLEGQMSVALEISGYVAELKDVPSKSEDPAEYCWDNPFWNNADALVQYGLLRSRKPARVVEIGCGYSTLLMAKALASNVRESAANVTAVTLVEPHPRVEVLSKLPSHWECSYTPLQRAPLSAFESLQKGDVLFYDGSHCCKVASDVNWFFFRILPILAPGVLIHLHDIFLPDEYPESWIFERGQTWNEQYCLQAFLMHNSRYTVEIANWYLVRKRHAALLELYQNVQPVWGVSFWLSKR
jgi:hypothetical protein